MNWETITLAVIAGLPAFLVALAAFIQSLRTHKAVNSRMDEMLGIVKKAAIAEGNLQGVKDEKAAEHVRKTRGTK